MATALHRAKLNINQIPVFMSNTANTLKTPEEEQNALTEKQAAEQDTDVNVKPDVELTDISEVTSETKVRHDTVK